MNRFKTFLNKNRKPLYWSLFLLILLVIVFIQYYGLVHFRYPVPPGDDPMNHYNMILAVKENGFWKTLLGGGYPPGYHWLIGHIAAFLHQDPFQVMLWSYPAILVLTSLSVFVATYFLFGQAPAMLALLFYFFATRTPIQSLNDGNYPNLLAAQFLLPLFVLALVNILRTNSWKKIIWLVTTLVGFFLIIATHHIATFYLLAILVVSTPILIIYFWKVNRWRWTQGTAITAAYLAILILTFILFVKSDLFASARDLGQSMIQFSIAFPFVHIVARADSALWPLTSFMSHLGRLPVIAGFLGLITLPFIYRKDKNKIIPITIICVWIIILTVGSQFNFLSNPERMARDLAAPLSILAAALIIFTWNQYKKWPARAVLVLLVLFLAFSATRDRITNAFAYEPAVSLTGADLTIIDYLNKQPYSYITAKTCNDYLPLFLPNHALAIDLSANHEANQYYNFVYVTDQHSWLPERFTKDEISYYLASPVGYELVQKSTGPTSDVYLFRVVKQP